MADNVFIDTNILVYAYLDADEPASRAKHLKAVASLQDLSASSSQIILSTQVLGEYYSALLKHKISDSFIQESIHALLPAVLVSEISVNTA